ncbi:unnamed protein product [Timema podura]|uniref:Uncharacterized protein n=1 Tax=Timema podura TaxID=61482 RepID=A0ABN7P4K7_TIMPD|nr:unnamed protein product [Timema podura]
MEGDWRKKGVSHVSQLEQYPPLAGEQWTISLISDKVHSSEQQWAISLISDKIHSSEQQWTISLISDKVHSLEQQCTIYLIPDKVHNLEQQWTISLISDKVHSSEQQWTISLILDKVHSSEQQCTISLISDRVHSLEQQWTISLISDKVHSSEQQCTISLISDGVHSLEQQWTISLISDKVHSSEQQWTISLISDKVHSSEQQWTISLISDKVHSSEQQWTISLISDKVHSLEQQWTIYPISDKVHSLEQQLTMFLISDKEQAGMWVIRPRRSQANLLVVYLITSNMAGSLEQNNDHSKLIWSSIGSLSLGAVTSHSELGTSHSEFGTSHSELGTIQTEIGMNHTETGYEVYTSSEPNLTDLNHSSRSRENVTRPVARTDYMAVPRLFDIIAYRFNDPETTTLIFQTPYSNYSEVSNVSQFPTSFHSRNTTRQTEPEGRKNETYQEVERFGIKYFEDLEKLLHSTGRKKRTVPLQKIELPPQGITDSITLRHNQLNKLTTLNAIISHDTFPSTEVLETSMKTTITKLDKRSLASSVSSSGSYYLGSEDTYLPEVVSLDHPSPKADHGNETQVFDKLPLWNLPARTARRPPFRYKRQTDKVPEGLSDASSAPSYISDRSLLTQKGKVPEGLLEVSSAPSYISDRSLLTQKDKAPQGLSDASSAPSYISDRSLLTQDKVPQGLSDISSAPSYISDRSLLTSTDNNHLKAAPPSLRERRMGMIVKKSSERIQGFSVQSSGSVSKSNNSRDHSSAGVVDSNQDTAPLNTYSGQHQMNDTSSLIQEDMYKFPYATMMSSVPYVTPLAGNVPDTTFNQGEPPVFDEEYLDLGSPPVVIIQYFNPLFVDYDLHSSSYPHVHAHNTKVVEAGHSFKPSQSRSHKQRTHRTFSSEQQSPVQPKKAE